jgi:dihydrofolate reductase
MIIGIVAISENYAIGKNGKLPWHYSADMHFFRDTTTGHAVLMGANTWRSIGKPLPKRLNIVLSGASSVTPPAEVMRLMTKDEVIDLSRYLNRDVFIIGGAKIYAEFADDIEKWIVTRIPEVVADADTFMPPDFLDRFNAVETVDLGEGLKVDIMQRNSS